eukprot:5359870-Lingulodinium_polyedra.AAC.1
MPTLLQPRSRMEARRVDDCARASSSIILGRQKAARRALGRCKVRGPDVWRMRLSAVGIEA